ncbi:S-adenosylmethionine decarboxylase proenzyme, partial [Haematococcus lacustris]
DAPVLHNPVFEGSEKRVEVDFTFNDPTAAPAGLRGLSREQLDNLMTQACCAIVSSRSNDVFDAYVLSESSLFVYPTKWVLKTCGTTRLLHSMPTLLDAAAALGLRPRRCKYSRASFLFPDQQSHPHTSFDDEVAFLDKLFGQLDPNGRQAYVLGEDQHGLQWHVYLAGSPDTASVPSRATFNLEMCMTELCTEAAQQFVRNDKFVSSEQTTRDTGIVHLKPGALLDDFVFEPCGYSMNGIQGTGFMTIHVTPEAGFSYASVELSGRQEDVQDPAQVVGRALQIFKPGRISIAMSVDDAGAEGAAEWGCMMSVLPAGYQYQAANRQQLACGGSVLFITMCRGPAGKAAEGPASPTAVLHHVASFLSSPGCCDASSGGL